MAKSELLLLLLLLLLLMSTRCSALLLNLLMKTNIRPDYRRFVRDGSESQFLKDTNKETEKRLRKEKAKFKLKLRQITNICNSWT
jgi:hypothetical protein